MSEDLLFAKISEPEMTSINFDDHFRDRMGEVDRGHIEVFPKLWNLRPYSFRGSDINANTCEITTRPRMKQTQQSSSLDPKTTEMTQFFQNGAKFFRKY